MKIKIEYFKWFNNSPVMTEFEGNIKEFKYLQSLLFGHKVKTIKKGAKL